MEEQAPPAAANIEQPFTGLEVELAADEVKLGQLRLLEAHVVALKVGTGIDHARIEPHRVEVVRDVVVETDRLAIAAGRILGAVQMGGPLARASIGLVFRQPPQQSQDRKRLLPSTRAGGQDVGKFEGGHHVALDIEGLVQVGLGHRHLRARDEHFPERAWAIEDDGGRFRGIIRPVLPIPQPDIQGLRGDARRDFVENSNRQANRHFIRHRGPSVAHAGACRVTEMQKIENHHASLLEA